ncbi:MAG: hypothetical protein ACI8WB_002139 [Phenylobacterium sp.]|jgi:hypothetical protein
MSDEINELKMPISPAIAQAIEDGQRLISYIAKDGMATLPQSVTQSMIDAKYQSSTNEWTAKQEATFLSNYDQLAKIVYPVTVESINAIIPDQTGGSSAKTKADKAVASYRHYTMAALVILLLMQFYWLVGNNLRVNLKSIFDQREAIHATIMKGKTEGPELAQLVESRELANQQLDANYQLLKVWNSVTSVGIQFSGDLPAYTKERLSFVQLKQSTSGELDVAVSSEKQEPKQADLVVGLYKARIMYFKNILAADFFLEAFQNYILPLLYGLLGALIYVLRSLLKEIKLLTYTFDSEIRFRLRITLGALGGMVVGWFAKQPQGAEAVASLSPMALAFLVGYNVDLLFSMMDKLIDNIRQAIEKPDQPASAPAAAPAVQSQPAEQQK